MDAVELAIDAPYLAWRILAESFGGAQTEERSYSATIDISGLNYIDVPKVARAGTVGC